MAFRRVMTLREHQGWVVNVHAQRGVNGKIISASVNGDVRFWDSRNSESVLQIPTDTNLQAFEVHPMAAVFACGSMQQVRSPNGIDNRFNEPKWTNH